jgi:PAS domain S-box-containing protein
VQSHLPYPTVDILASVKAAIFLIQKDTLVFVNPEWERLTGYGSAECIGTGLRNYTHSDDWNLFEQALQKTLKSIDAGPFDCRLTHKNGDMLWVRAHLSALSQNGRTAVSGILVDITKRRQTEDGIRWSEGKYRSILESIQEVYFETDLKGCITFANSALSQHLGYSKEELLGMSNRQYTDEASRKRLFDAFHQLYLTGKPIKAVEETIIRKDGSRGISELSVSLIRDAEGKPVGYTGISRDVTERKEMEETIRQSEERYRTIINEMDEWYYESDLEGNLLYFNEAIARTLGYPPEKLSGKNFRDIISKQDADEIYKLFHRVFETGQSARNIPYQFLHPDGPITFAEFSIFPKRDQKGKICGFRAVGHDITEKKKAQHQQMLSEKMASISQLAAGAASKISNPTFFINSNLKTLSEYLSDITGLIKLTQSLPQTVACDNPATIDVLNQRMEEIRDKAKDLKIDFILEDLDSLIKESQASVEQIIHTIHDLETYEATGDDPPKQDDINENLEAALNKIWNELKYKAIITRDYGDLPKISCHSRQINQVFINLLRNAAQAIEEEGEIKISTRQPQEGYVEIRIEDSGVGIPQKNLSRIFDPFFTTKGTEKATGLGLHVAFSIIDRHQGNISVESKQGVGTTFIISLPVNLKAAG